MYLISCLRKFIDGNSCSINFIFNFSSVYIAQCSFKCIKETLHRKFNYLHVVT